MNQIFSQVEGRVKKGVVQILTNNMLLSITLTIFAMMLLKAFALDRKTLLRAFLILTVVNYTVLKATQDIRLPGEGFLREAFHQPIQKMNRQFILANNIESEEQGSSEESELLEDERDGVMGSARQEAQQKAWAGSALSGGGKQVQSRRSRGSRAGSSGLIALPKAIASQPFQEDKTFVL